MQSNYQKTAIHARCTIGFTSRVIELRNCWQINYGHWDMVFSSNFWRYFRNSVAKENHFIPIAQETFGSWGPSGLELLKDIGTRTIIASGNKRARANLFQNISMAMIRGNIINVKSTLPPLNKNKEFLFLN